ncbi:MAG: flavin reductase [Thermoleophilia bacterium]|nr:flavin reductase [Thermoleophilia bacterium]
MERPTSERIQLSTDSPIWRRFFTVAPLVVVGTREPSGEHDLAPKHMATPIGWENRFGFVCRPSHATQRNAERTGQFTISFPRPDAFLQAGLAASGRADDDSKPALAALPVREAEAVDGVVLEDAYLWLECELDRIVPGFEPATLIVGRIVAASADERYLRTADGDDADVIRQAPLLAYLSPGRFAEIRESRSFPLPADFSV